MVINSIKSPLDERLQVALTAGSSFQSKQLVLEGVAVTARSISICSEENYRAHLKGSLIL